MEFLTKDDFVKMDWTEYQHCIEKVYQDINSFLIKNNLRIDYIALNSSF